VPVVGDPAPFGEGIDRDARAVGLGRLLGRLGAAVADAERLVVPVLLGVLGLLREHARAVLPAHGLLLGVAAVTVVGGPGVHSPRCAGRRMVLSG
jgi:hypothetical protein